MLPLLQGTIVILAIIGIVVDVNSNVVAAPVKAGIAPIAWQDGPTRGVAATTTKTAVADLVRRRRFRSTHS